MRALATVAIKRSAGVGILKMLSNMYGAIMVTKQQAILIQTQALNAVTELTGILHAVEGDCSTEDFEALKRGVGLSIGRIQIELLEFIYQGYPELDHLKDVG
ncbi:MAG TPA: hypothetical protein VFZ23_12325 [Pyrinomonadaceae bacterium]